MLNEDKHILIVEINNNFFVISAGSYDEELKFKVIESKFVSSIGIFKGKIVDFEKCFQSLKKGINEIEAKINFIFKNVNILINIQEFESINICGFKKLNGNQIITDDISYILNDVKKKLNEVEIKKHIVHLFNTKFLLDNNDIKNLPIGLKGDFYSHQLSFFLINNNEYKDIISLLNKCNLKVDRVIHKSFIEGISLINEKKNNSFISILINEEHCQLVFFLNSAFCFFQSFNFGSNIILKDVSKVCSLSLSEVNHIFSDICFDRVKISDKIFLDKKYFVNSKIKNISLKYVYDIFSARISEIVDIVFNNNINIKDIKKNNLPIYLLFNDEKIYSSLSMNFNKHFTEPKLIENINYTLRDQRKIIQHCGELIISGWSREAIPIIKKKRSLITRIFSSLFK